MNGNIEITFMRHGRSRADDENVFEGRRCLMVHRSGASRYKCL